MSRGSRHRAEAGASEEDKRPKRTAAEVLHYVGENLELVELGVADLLGDDPARRLAGFRNVAVYGHATTQTLQNLRSVDSEAFNAWYEPLRSEMRDDPLMKFFWDLRSQILKEGRTGTLTNVHQIDYFGPENQAALKPILAHPPPGARGFFIGDQLGGNGWEIVQPDGTISKYYVQLPPEVTAGSRFSLHPDNPPTRHRGQDLADTSIQALAQHYLAYLRDLAARAKARFSPA